MLLKALAVGGHVSLIGASLAPSGTMLDPLLLTGRGITVGVISVGSRTDVEARFPGGALSAQVIRLRHGAPRRLFSSDDDALSSPLAP